MTKQEVGQFIRDERLKQNLSQAELAEKAGIKWQRILEIERAKKNYGVEQLLKILTALKVDILPPVVGVLSTPRKSVYDFSKVTAATPKDEPKSFQSDIFKHIPPFK